MSTLSKILNEYPDQGYNKAHGFDDAIIGVSSRSNLVYSIDKCIDILRKDGLSYDHAVDFFYENVDSMYVGKDAPLFVKTL
jgi:hypothetical protein